MSGKQYCRYCAFCFEADDFRCSNHPKGKQPHWTEAQIKRENHCPNFALSEDVITGRQYKPREHKERHGRDIDGQISLFKNQKTEGNNEKQHN